MNEMMVVAGTRPEIIKMAPILREFQNNSVPFVFVHCGQHYDYNNVKIVIIIQNLTNNSKREIS